MFRNLTDREYKNEVKHKNSKWINIADSNKMLWKL